MTQEQQTSKNLFRLNGGLNTEFNELGFPDGYSTDEANYELLLDGSRRRRKGLAEESGGAARTVATHTTSEFHQTYLWRNVGGDPTKDILVYKKGAVLHLTPADETVSDGWVDVEINVTDFKTSGATTANSDNAPLSFTQGRGRLLVTGQYVYPFYVEYDATADEYSATKINVRVRAFDTIDDGTAITNEPTASPIPDDHRYNVRNRGWTEADLTSFNSLSKWPARNALWYKGYRRTIDTTTDTTAILAEKDGVLAWDSTLMDAEVFGQSSAPVGSLFLNPHDSTYAIAAGESSESYNITSWEVADETTTPWVITLTLDGNHGYSGPPYDEFTITGNSFAYIGTSGGRDFKSTDSLDGTWTPTSYPAANTIRFTWDGIANWSSWTGGGSAPVGQEGLIDGGTIVRSTGIEHDDSLRAIEWHAGRAFYAGFANKEWADSLFFSQIVDNPNKYGKCYQEADPTDENFNALVASDGGEIIMPGMGGVIELVSLRNNLLVFSSDGVWEVSGGRGVFAANNFQVRKLTDEGCSSSTSIVKIESAAMYTGPGGIYLIAPNQYTGLLEVTNVITQTIQTKWNSVVTSAQEACQAFYDDALKRVYFMLRTEWDSDEGDYVAGAANEYDEILVFDTKISAWYRYVFREAGLLTGCAIPTADDPSTSKKAKFIYKATSTTVKVADFAQTSFDDWSTTHSQPVPYMYTAWDNIGDFQRRRQAPIITVFSKRTETGYVDNGTGWDPTNYSSTLMSGYWDWTNDAVSNKITATQEVYRKVRDFAPAAATDVDGYPVVVTRNKLRGRGRVLQLKFEGAADKDSHILGFTTNYKVSRKK